MNDLHTAVARMFGAGFHEPHLPDHFRRLIDRGISTAILFARNIQTPPQVAQLCADLKRHAGRPFMVCTDQEGGRVLRLRDGFTEIPAMRAVGQAGDEQLARRLGRVLGRELRAVNIDLDLAPVLDVDTNPANPVIAARSFGREPELVSRLGCAVVQGIQGQGVAACGKHFPGHGDTSQDSHVDLPRLPHDMQRLERVELAPFAAAIRSGIASIMTAHVVFQAVDPSYPATMSRPVIQGILREKLGFDGVICSDDLEMKAIAKHFPFEEVLIRCANAGVDLFLISHQAELQDRAIDMLVAAVERGEVPRERIEQSNRRIERMMGQYVKPPHEDAPLEVLNSAEHREVVEEIRRRCDAAALAPGRDPTDYTP
jgi:beta-N-acetylhexosaminidase